jgi:uncharacterized protein with PQ loop repeat
MYTLLLLGIVAVLLLAGSKREGLEATAVIKAPPYSDEEKDRIWNMIPQADKTAYRTSLAGAATSNTTSVDGIMKNSASEVVEIFYNEFYRNATTPITLANVTTFAGNLPQATIPAYRSWATAVLNAYFVNQALVNTPPPSGTGPSPNPQTGNWATSGSYNQTRAQFDAKKAEYDALVTSLSTSTNPTAEDITRLRNLNREAFALLEQAIQALSTSQVANMTAVNQELSEMLARIDRQYNILVENSDRLEALRRIREFEEVKSNGSVNLFMILLLVFSLALLVIMMFSQRMNATSPTAPASPMMTANLT